MTDALDRHSAAGLQRAARPDRRAARQAAEETGAGRGVHDRVSRRHRVRNGRQHLGARRRAAVDAGALRQGARLQRLQRAAGGVPAAVARPAEQLRGAPAVARRAHLRPFARDGGDRRIQRGGDPVDRKVQGADQGRGPRRGGAYSRRRRHHLPDRPPPVLSGNRLSALCARDARHQDGSRRLAERGRPRDSVVRRPARRRARRQLHALRADDRRIHAAGRRPGRSAGRRSPTARSARWR